MTKISVHAIQTFPACNLNSDESGAVKTMMFGGTNRMRISSQSWKASVRETFHNGGDATLYATRTKRSPHLIIERALELNTELDRTDAEKFWEKVMSSILKSKKSEARARKKKDFKAQEAERERAERANNGGTTEVETAEEILSDALFTVSDAQVDAAAHVVLSAMAGKIADKDIKVKVIEALSGGVSGEQALFGRFFADEKKLCIDGVTNVAHAIGIIPMPEGFDYYTARDDLLDDGEIDSGEKGKGAAHLGFKEFSSGPVYRHTVVDVDQLAATLGDRDRAIDVALTYIHAFLSTVPHGAQTSFEATTVPDTVLVEVGDGLLPNYASAFEEGDTPTVSRATKALVNYVPLVNKAFSVEHTAAFALTTKPVDDVTVLGTRKDTLRDILDGVRATLMEA